jgi:hypothetical protein
MKALSLLEYGITELGYLASTGVEYSIGSGALIHPALAYEVGPVLGFRLQRKMQTSMVAKSEFGAS